MAGSCESDKGILVGLKFSAVLGTVLLPALASAASPMVMITMQKTP